MKLFIIDKKNPDFYFRKIWEKASMDFGWEFVFLNRTEELNEKLGNYNGEIIYLKGDFIPCGASLNKISKPLRLFSSRDKIFYNIVEFKNKELFFSVFKERDKMEFFLKNILKEEKKDFYEILPDNVEEFKYSGPKPLFLSYIGNLKEEFKEFVCKTVYNRFYSDKKDFTAVHGGDMGDVIYSIPAFKELNVNKIILNPGGFYNTKMSFKAAQLLKPFLEKQGFMVDIKERICLEDGDLFFDFFREGVEDMEKNHLSLSNCEKVFIRPNISRFKAEADKLYIADVVINRSPRYRNPIFDYSYLINDIPKDFKICFVGLKEEYESFVKIYGMREKVFYYPTADFNALAGVINGAKIFIGNQSSPYAIAESLKVKRIQECCNLTPNCRGSDENSLDVITENDLYSAKVFLFKTLGIRENISKTNGKTLLFSLINIKDENDIKKILVWLKNIMDFKKQMGFDNVLLIDNGSERENLLKFKSIISDSHMEYLTYENGRYIIPFIIKEKEISVISFKDKIFTNSDKILAEFWRGYLWGIIAAYNLAYEKAIFLSSNSYVLSERMAFWIKNQNKFSCVYEKPSNKINVSLQIIPKQKFPYFSSIFYGEKGINEDFFYGVGMDKYSYRPEYFLKFENSFEEFELFEIRKYFNGTEEWVKENADFVEIVENKIDQIEKDKFYEIEKIVIDRNKEKVLNV
ncbi:MAG: hypothetical protein AB1602_04225 [Elusimicrobiota bacterium]